MKLYKRIALLLLLFALVILAYNSFFVGKRYSTAELNIIYFIFFTIIGIIIFFIIIIAFKDHKQQKKIRNIIKEIALANDFEYKDLKDEINIILKSSMGGYGIYMLLLIGFFIF